MKLLKKHQNIFLYRLLISIFQSWIKCNITCCSLSENHTVVLKKKFYEVRDLSKEESLNYLWYIWQYANWPIVFFQIFVSLFKNWCYNWLRLDEKMKILNFFPNLNLEFILNFAPYVQVNWKKRTLFPIAYFSYILSMFGWLRYFTMDVITGLFMFSEIGSQLVYSAILRLLTILEKRIFRIWVVLISFSTISSSSIKVSFPLDTILSDKNGLMVFQEVNYL